MPISCHFRHCKALLVTSLSHASRKYLYLAAAAAAAGRNVVLII